MIDRQYLLFRNYRSQKRKSLQRKAKVYTPDFISLLEEHSPTKTSKELSELMFIHLGITMSAKHIKNAKKNLGMCDLSKLNNKRPLYSEATNDKNKGFIKIKIKESGTRNEQWLLKHRWVWEQSNGPIPPGHRIIFADGNKRNFKLDNLMCVSRSVCAYLNTKKILSSSIDAETLKALVATISLDMKIKEREK